jgi:hypothetical protein
MERWKKPIFINLGKHCFVLMDVLMFGVNYFLVNFKVHADFVVQNEVAGTFCDGRSSL